MVYSGKIKLNPGLCRDMTDKIKIQLNSSVDRPAWTSENLRAYNHRWRFMKKQVDYYIKTKGRE